MSATVLPLEEIRERLASGEAPREIKDDLERKGFTVPKSTLDSIMRRAGIRRRRPQPWPWAVEPQHRHLYPLVMLRYLTRRDNGGKPLSEDQSAELTRWLNRLDSDDVVLDYRPNRTPPFVYARRRYLSSGEMIDPGLFRDRSRFNCGCLIDRGCQCELDTSSES